ncbi:hypothetical protein GOP47_0017799 [Adiantum capillus-veneris]|uniref:Smr domain-containing protein n=1 Tax=Adiantum capillus-veneris TaxID=13818 RepID=A0A9D4ZC52_ADICA|nr:hypothetical protein GOP47_0017799 [Adiantum capillus-veneris]
MAERRARLRQGWSALTHAHRESPFVQGPPIPPFSSELSVPDPSQFSPLSLHPLPTNPPTIPSFAGILKQHLGSASLSYTHRDSNDEFQEIDPSHLHTQAVSRLCARHPWADVSLISDILESLGSDEENASAVLVSMSPDNTERVSAVTDAECCSSLQLNDGNGENYGRAGATEDSSPVPMEPEWEEEDLYLRNRRDALKLSRASGKHARGAYKAFLSGDYSRAKILSKQAKEERIEAEKLHAEAAKEILEARNGETPKDLWCLDLHGLHVNEAVVALQHRLQEIETGMSNPRYVEDGPLSQRTREKLNMFQGSALKSPLLNKELKVITGVGNHSRGGGSLPMAIQNFLIQNRYKFEESRPGVVAVHPKFYLSKGK